MRSMQFQLRIKTNIFTNTHCSTSDEFPWEKVFQSSCTSIRKEGWAPKNWRFWTVVLEKTLEHLLDYKEIQPVHPKGNQPWILIGRTDAETEAPVFWSPNVNSWFTGKKFLMLGKIEGRRRRGHQRMRWLDVITDSKDMGLVNSGSWWWTGRPGVLRFMGLQRVGHDWATELNWKWALFSG